MSRKDYFLTHSEVARASFELVTAEEMGLDPPCSLYTDGPRLFFAAISGGRSWLEKWRMSIHLLFIGCKVKNFPKWAMFDKHDALSLLVGFDPLSEIQTRVVQAAAELERLG